MGPKKKGNKKGRDDDWEEPEAPVAAAAATATAVPTTDVPDIMGGVQKKGKGKQHVEDEPVASSSSAGDDDEGGDLMSQIMTPANKKKGKASRRQQRELEFEAALGEGVEENEGELAQRPPPEEKKKGKSSKKQQRELEFEAALGEGVEENEGESAQRPPPEDKKKGKSSKKQQRELEFEAALAGGVEENEGELTPEDKKKGKGKKDAKKAQTPAAATPAPAPATSPATKPAAAAPAKPASAPAVTETPATATEAAPAADGDSDDDSGDETTDKKKKKKKKKKAGEKEAAPKKSAMGAALKAMLDKQKEMEEKLRQQQEEEERRIAEEIALQEEKERKLEEAKQRRKEKEKAKKEQLKKEGKLLAPAAKQRQQRNQEVLKNLMSNRPGIKIDGLEAKNESSDSTEETKKKKVVYTNKKKGPAATKKPSDGSAEQQQQQQPEDHAEEEEEEAVESALSTEPGKPADETPAAADEEDDDWEARDTWEELEEAPIAKPVVTEQEKPKPAPAAAPKAVVPAPAPAPATTAPTASKPRHQQHHHHQQHNKNTKPGGKGHGKGSKAPVNTKTLPNKVAPNTPRVGNATDMDGDQDHEDQENDDDDEEEEDEDDDDDDNKESESESESESEDESDEEEDDSEDEAASQLQAAEKAKEERKLQAKLRREQRLQEAMARRSKDDLRSPICCILGHVDTGKTKILDKIRQTNVQDNEAGGITQQIGATYFPHDTLIEKTAVLKSEMEIKVPGLLVIDTPGHESFSNLRSRGSSLCNIAILVVDIMHGLEPQTIESLNMLKARKTPFIVALNKVDRLFGWQAIPNNGVVDSLEKQKPNVKQEFENRLASTKVAFAEQGLNSEVYFRNEDKRKVVSLVPTSAITGEGLPDLIALIVDLTQKMMADSLMYISEVEATVLEVKVIEGQGTTIDVILSNGIIKEGDRIVVCGLNGPIVTNIRALLTPQPLRELRVKGQYVHHKECKAAIGVKISAPGLEKAIAGSRLLVVGPDDDEEDLKEEVKADLAALHKAIDKSGKGVWVQASTLGSLEALLEFLKTSKIPVHGINIGPVHKKDVTYASTMLEHKKEYATMLCFDVEIDRDAEKLAEDLGVRIFTANIIYHLFDAFTKYMEEIKERRKAELAPTAVFPCIIRIIPNNVFNNRSPIVVGVDVVEGNLRLGTPLCVPAKNSVYIGRVTGIEKDHKALEIAKKGQSVAIKIEMSELDPAKMVGRHFEEKDDIVSKISRESIDIMKEAFRNDMSKEDWHLIVKLKKMLNIP